MTKNNIKLLQSKIDNGTVKICFTDGEEVLAKIISVSESEKDIIFDITHTNHKNKYAGKKGVFSAKFDEIKSVKAA